MSDILIIDDEAGIRKTLSSILTDEGYRVDTASTGEDGIEKIKKQKFSLVLLDIWLPGIDGVDTLKKIKEIDPHTEVIIISGHGNVETAVKITKLGAFDFIEKPFDLEKTVIIVQNAMRQSQLRKENLLYREKEEEKFVMIGSSKPMTQLKEVLKRAAPTEGRVMIYGENGTGKELAARMIHRYSDRADKPFVAVNCAAIPEDLIESELFGHKKGAFTGANENKVGKFEQADGGTLFLDEIGDMSLKTQAKVLRVLEEEVIQPVGDVRNIAVNVRVIAATNKALEEEIANGTFRQDLYFRLNVLPVQMPPLRQRADDIPELLDFYQGFFSRRYGIQRKIFDEDAIILLKNYLWPGNVRELRNFIERIYIMHPESKIEKEVVGKLMLHVDADSDEYMEYKTLREAMENFEKQYIMSKLKENEANIGKTANSIGIERTSLYRKMKKYKINGAIDD